MGAWIETKHPALSRARHGSHPTWVRGLKRIAVVGDDKRVQVAPYVGAWIETKFGKDFFDDDLSHPTWVRGLKPPFGG